MRLFFVLTGYPNARNRKGGNPMKHTKHILTLIALTLAASLLFSACGTVQKEGGATEGSGTVALQTSAVTDKIESAFADISNMKMSFTDRDGDASYDEANATAIVFRDSAVAVTGDGAKASGNNVTITAAGTYLVSGKSGDGCITVSLAEGDKAQLVLNGLDLTSKDGPALRILSGDKVFVTLAPNSENSLADGSAYELELNGSTADGAVFSKSDLCFNGTGALTVTGNYKHGIASKDDLILAGGTYTVTAEKVALSGKDCVKITSSDLTLVAGTDGIRSDNDEDESRGFIYIQDGTFTITAGNDGIQAETVLKIDNGTFTVTTGGGSGNASSAGQGQFNPDWGFGKNGTTNTTEDSAKGLKAGVDLLIEGGGFTLNTADDALHANGSVAIDGGKLDILSGDDGIHADSALSVTAGTISVSKSYEGLEGNDIGIFGGVIRVTASDDGLNAAGGNDGSSVNGRPGMGGFSDSSDSSITIAGGFTVIDASGDGIDSNGIVSVTGGVTLVSGPTNNGNGAFDYGKSASVSGGTLVALGSSGMATGFTEATNQGAILVNFDTQSSGTNLALCDNDGKVIVSFTGTKQYQSAVITSPGIETGKTYTLMAGGTVAGADENGYAENSALSGGNALMSVEMTSSLYGSGMGGFPGGNAQGGQGGFPGQSGDGSGYGFPGQDGSGNMPTPPDGNGTMPGFPGQDGQGGFPGGNGGNGGQRSPGNSSNGDSIQG